jgi:hypothetical protein
MLRLFLTVLFFAESLCSNSQVNYCYSTDTVQSQDNFIRLSIASNDHTDITKTIFKIETAKPINPRKVRLSIGTPDMLLQRTVDFELVEGNLKLKVNPFAFVDGGNSLSLFASYEFSSTDPIVVTISETAGEPCQRTKHTYRPLQSKWENVLLTKNIVPSRDALQLLNIYNPKGLNGNQEVIYPFFEPVSQEESRSFEQQYLADTEPDSRLPNYFKRSVAKLKRQIEAADVLLITPRGEIGRKDFALREINNERKVVLNHLSELQEGLNDISSKEIVYQVPRITLSIVVDEINTLNDLIPGLKDTANNSLVMQFVEDLQLLTYPYASKTLQGNSTAATYQPKGFEPSNSAGSLFHFAHLPTIKENYLRQFHFYIYKNAEPAPKKQYRVYCVPAAKFEYYLRKGKNLNELSLHMSPGLGSVASHNLPLAVYYIFAVKQGETKWSVEPQKYHTGRIVRESANDQRPYSFCIDVNN